MNKVFNKRNILLCGFLPSLSTDEVDLEKYKEARGLYIEDPWERVQTIFSRDDQGNLHPELLYAMQLAEIGFFTGGCFGGFSEALRKSEEFHFRSDTNIYQNKKEAYRLFTNHATLSFFRGGIKWAPSFAFFLGGFALVSSCCELYRNKPKIIDSTVAGAVMGSLCRFMFGIKGMISGGIVGSVLGTISGIAVWSVTKLTKTDQLELKYAQFAITKYRNEYFDKLARTSEVDDPSSERSDSASTDDIDPLDKLPSEAVEVISNEVKSSEVKNTEEKK